MHCANNGQVGPNYVETFAAHRVPSPTVGSGL